MTNPADRKMEVIPMLKKSPCKAVQFLLVIVMATVAAVFGVLPAHAGKSQPVPPPPQPSTTYPDSDLDGLPDSMETGAIAFLSLSSTPPTYSVCSPTNSVRANCLDPIGKDVFVFVKKLSSGSLLPVDAGGLADLNTLLEPVTRPSSTGTGLGIAIHRLIPAARSTWSPTSRNIPGDPRTTNPQKAIFITESADTSDPQTLGTSGVGTPNYSGGDITIFTQRIRNQVSTVCNGTTVTKCTDMNGASTIDQVVRNWQIHVASHEVAHSLNLRNPLDAVNREHYATATRSTDLHSILEQGMYKEYPDSGTAKFFISKDFTSAEQKQTFYIP